MRTSLLHAAVGAAVALAILVACHKSDVAKGPATQPASTPASAPQIETKAIAIQLNQADGYTMVGIMGAYEPKSRSFWWRATPMIAEGSMLESYYRANCKFFMDGGRVADVCLRGSDMVMLTTDIYVDSLDAGMEKAQQDLRENPNLMAEYKGPHDALINFKSWGQDFTTPQGTPPASIRDVRFTGSGYVVEVACVCGDAIIQLNRDRFMYDLKKK